MQSLFETQTIQEQTPPAKRKSIRERKTVVFKENPHVLSNDQDHTPLVVDLRQQISDLQIKIVSLEEQIEKNDKSEKQNTPH